MPESNSILPQKSAAPQQYFEYINYITKNSQQLPLKPASFYVKIIKQLNGIINQLPSVVYLLDYRSANYLFLGKNCEQMLGWTHKEIITRGQQWHIKNNIHPDDLAVFSSDVFSKFLAHTRSFSKSELKNIRFSVNFRCKRKDGAYMQALQQYVVVETDKTGNPLLTLGTWTDITAHKTDTKVVFAVSRYNKKTGFSLITTDTFPHLKVTISNRENEIIKHIIKGFSSKQIAQKLHLSLHTVNAHRRNILKKTKCKNTPELGHYIINNGLL
jgi:DNA-binding CsgD family transcriptional regulator